VAAIFGTAKITSMITFSTDNEIDVKVFDGNLAQCTIVDLRALKSSKNLWFVVYRTHKLHSVPITS
jgi:hypothetical protein